MVIAIISGGCLLGILAILKGSDAYDLATQYASENQLINAEIGEVTGFGFLPQGNISTNSSSSGTSGQAEARGPLQPRAMTCSSSITVAA